MGQQKFVSCEFCAPICKKQTTQVSFRQISSQDSCLYDSSNDAKGALSKHSMLQDREAAPCNLHAAAAFWHERGQSSGDLCLCPGSTGQQSSEPETLLEDGCFWWLTSRKAQIHECIQVATAFQRTDAFCRYILSHSLLAWYLQAPYRQTGTPPFAHAPMSQSTIQLSNKETRTHTFLLQLMSNV